MDKAILNDGYVYVMYTPCLSVFGESVYKIGYSTNPDKRLNQFNDVYYNTSKFIYVKHSKNAYQIEQLIHILLDNYRIYYLIVVCLRYWIY